MRKCNFNHAMALSLNNQPVEDVCANLLRRRLPAFSHRYIDAALRGDAEAAGNLLITANDLRPLVLLCLYASCCNSSGFKEALVGIWSHDGPLVLRDVNASLLAEMFKCGGVHPGRQGPVTVYRGGQG